MVTLTEVSYSMAAASFGIFAAVLATPWWQRMRGAMLLPAALMSVAWAVTNVVVPGDYSLPALAIELAWALAWIVFLLRTLGGLGARAVSPMLRLGPWMIAALTAGMGIVATTSGQTLNGRAAIQRLAVAGGLGLAISGFVLVEQVIRNTRRSHSWEVKFIWLGVGAFFAYDIALYSTSFVLGTLQTTLYVARGFAVAAVVPLLALGVNRVKEFQPQVLMSQRLAFYTGSLIISGIYLIAVSLAGYFVRGLGGSWGEALQIVLVFVALVGLTTVLASRAIRARLRVELSKHLGAYKYDYRAEWLDLTTRLTRDVEGSSLPQRTIEAFVDLARVKSGAVLALRDDTLHFAAALHFDANGIEDEPISSPFCKRLEEREWIVDLDRVRRKLDQDADIPVPEWLLRLPDAWLVIPLLHERKLYGLVILCRGLVVNQLTWEDLDLLRTAGRQAASYVALEHSAEALGRERQFAALNRFTAFLMHDLSNIVAQQRLIVENAARHKSNPAFIDDTVRTIDNTVRRMTRLIAQLKTESAEPPVARRVPLEDLCRSAVARMGDRVPAPQLALSESSAGVEVIVAAERLEHVLEHIIRNAQDATPSEGSIVVSIRNDEKFAVIDVTDTGQGMSADFIRDRLFRPFDTTKGAKGMGIGVFQAREFARACGGDVHVTSVLGSGTSFVITLPLAL